MKIYIDGNFYEKEEAKISVFDHGLLYGDGIFEGIRIYGGRIFRLMPHLERLYQGARVLQLTIPLSITQLAQAVTETAVLNAREQGYIRLVVTRGTGDLGVDPAKCSRASVIIIVDDIRLYPEECYKQGIAVHIASVRRTPAECLDPRVKSLNYLNNVLAKIEASQAGCLEAVLLNQQGFVAECTGDNIFIVKQGTLYTPASFLGLLNGITRGVALELAAELSLPCREATLTCYDLFTAEECFLTGTGAEIMPVTKIGGRQIGDGKPGAVTAALGRAFRQKTAA